MFALSSTITASEIDDAFRRFEKELPPAETISQMNGFTLACTHHKLSTFTLLAAIADKLPIKSDADLLDVLPWCEHSDGCLRQIAINCVIDRIGYKGPITGTYMNDPENYQFLGIIFELKAFLDAKKVAYKPEAFGRFAFTISERDFEKHFTGTWIQDKPPGGREPSTIEFYKGVIVTRQVRGPQAHYFSTKIAAAGMNEKHQFAPTGEWDQEASNKGFNGERITPSKTEYKIWFATQDVVWFHQYENGFWEKYRRRKDEKE